MSDDVVIVTDNDVVSIDVLTQEVVTLTDDAETVSISESSVEVVTVSESDAVAVSDTDIVVVSVGEQGPAGRDGAPGGTTATYTSFGALSSHKVVKQVSAGIVDLVDPTNPADFGAAFAVTVTSTSGPASITTQSLSDLDEPGWSWTPDLPIYVGLNGSLTQTAPAGAAFVQIAGWAVSPTRMLIRFSEPILL